MPMVYSPYVLRNLGHEFGKRRIYLGGVLLMALILLLKISGIPNRVVQDSGEIQWLQEDWGPFQIASQPQFPYDDGEAVYAERWTFLSDPFAALPEEERSFTVIYFQQSDALFNVTARISPSGRYFIAHTGPFSVETADLGADGDRRVWERSNHLLYYTGGNPDVEAALGEMGYLRFDGRASDPETWTLSRWEVLTSWMYFQDAVDILLILLVLALFLALSLRAPKRRRPSASR